MYRQCTPRAQTTPVPERHHRSFTISYINPLSTTPSIIDTKRFGVPTLDSLYCEVEANEKNTCPEVYIKNTACVYQTKMKNWYEVQEKSRYREGKRERERARGGERERFVSKLATKTTSTTNFKKVKRSCWRSKSQLWVGHWFPRYSLACYTKFVSYDKSLLMKITIQIELSLSKTQQL